MKYRALIPENGTEACFFAATYFYFMAASMAA